MFPCMIARNSTIEIISSGMGESRNGALLLVSTYVTNKLVHFLINLESDY